ncbi:MAG: diphthamide synthesis protein [Deltaproteobacteria bacterium]|nr:diphthamide synthesis protein [Deltaproteobacteria bacterium]
MIDTNSVLKKIRAKKARRVFIQVPEGLKMKVFDISTELEKSGIDSVISLTPCYGACDLKENEAKMLGCDLILHVGHSDYGVKTRIPVIYEEYRVESDPTSLLNTFLAFPRQRDY